MLNYCHHSILHPGIYFKISLLHSLHVHHMPNPMVNQSSGYILLDPSASFTTADPSFLLKTLSSLVPTLFWFSSLMSFKKSYFYWFLLTSLRFKLSSYSASYNLTKYYYSVDGFQHHLMPLSLRYLPLARTSVSSISISTNVPGMSPLRYKKGISDMRCPKENAWFASKTSSSCSLSWLRNDNYSSSY